MLTIAGEGIELPVSSEHNTRVDFEAAARSAGVRRYFTPVLGTEVTTPALGHFNVFPMPPQGRAIEQDRPTGAGFAKSIDAAARLRGPGRSIVLNHGLDEHGGFRPRHRPAHRTWPGEDREAGCCPPTRWRSSTREPSWPTPGAAPRLDGPAEPWF
jgi:hypothetical protein